MKGFKTLVLLASSSIVASQLIYLPLQPIGESPIARRSEQQKPLNLPPMPPPSDSNSDLDHPPGHGAVILSDVMSRDKSINIFAGLAQDIEPVTLRLDDSSKNTTVLAPLNSAVEALPRKPWENPYDYNNLGVDAYEGDDGRERATRNLRRFVEAHLVPQSPWRENEKIKTIGGGREVWWESRDGTRYIQPDNIEVVSVARTVANGELWIIKGVHNYAQRP
ncbi:hypothetical protein ACRALDRAFT_1064737 [Sodiomyces alcalophilus JCM 7366]|uniref:uncharacterized protein n=1 Tax=Sodiomyces alcalophilus JCM 7366 TaxID=591952 RepID=UPI0039B6D223